MPMTSFNGPCLRPLTAFFVVVEQVAVPVGNVQWDATLRSRRTAAVSSETSRENY